MSSSLQRFPPCQNLPGQRTMIDLSLPQSLVVWKILFEAPNPPFFSPGLSLPLASLRKVDSGNPGICLVKPHCSSHSTKHTQEITHSIPPFFCFFPPQLACKSFILTIPASHHAHLPFHPLPNQGSFKNSVLASPSASSSTLQDQVHPWLPALMCVHPTGV